MGIEARLLSTRDTASVAETNAGTKRDKYVSPFVLKEAISEGIVGAESNTNKVTSISSSSTDVQYPSAKLLFDKSIKENINIIADTVNSTVNIDTDTSLIWYFTTAATANWTRNFRASATVSLNTRMNIGESISGCIMVTQGSTAYIPSTITIDGVAPTVTKWEDGAVPTSSTANSIDMYFYTIIKTGNTAFTLLKSVKNYT